MKRRILLEIVIKEVVRPGLNTILWERTIPLPQSALEQLDPAYLNPVLEMLEKNGMVKEADDDPQG